MSGTTEVQNASRRQVRPRALAEIRYNTINSVETGTSSEEDAPEFRAIAPKDAQSLVGVSLGREQTRLKTAQTPAEEKAAAIEEAGGFFEGPPIPEAVDIDEESEKEELSRTNDGAGGSGGAGDGAGSGGSSGGSSGVTVSAPSQREDRTPRTHTRSRTEASVIRMPSPWRSGQKIFKKIDHRSSIKDGLRQRAATGPGGHTESWREAFMSSFPSLPRHFTFTSPFSFGHHDDHKDNDGGSSLKRSGSFFGSWSSSSNTSPTRRSRNSSIPGLDARSIPTSANRQSMPVDARAAPRKAELAATPTLERPISRQMYRTHSDLGIRRSASDTSLQTFKTGASSLYRVPSLGDDSRFEHVQEQVNSRIKAIKDSFQDTNLKLPGLPNLPNLPNLSSISNLTLSTLNEKMAQSTGRQSSGVISHQRNASGGQKPCGSPKETKSHPPNPRTSISGGFTANGAKAHPHFSKAMAGLTGDVVVLGGYRGSILRSADPPHRQLWVPIKVGLNIRKVDLEVGLEAEDDETAEEKVIPSGMLTHIGPVDISRRLFKRLRASENARSGQLRIHDYGYDWRLDPNFLSRRLIEFLEKLPCNQPGTPKEHRGATVIAHSLGGLITRHAVNKRPDLFAGVIYAGVPATCVNILGPFRNGDDVLLSSRVLTAQVNFTIRTSFALLPLNGRCFFNKETKEEYKVDFFDPQTWIDYRLSPCVARPLPPFGPSHQSTGFAGIMSSVASVLPTRKSSLSVRTKQAAQHPAEGLTGGLAKPGGSDFSEGNMNAAVARRNIDHEGTDNLPSSKRTSSPSSNVETAAEEQSTSVATAVTIPRDAAVRYLTRVLASVKKFKEELAFDPAHGDANVYPPAAVIYGKTTPTVYGAKVACREAIKHADAYDDLAFASGDGVVLARAAMLPEGYQVAKGGIVDSDRGHVTLLGDLEAVGKCLRAIVIARRKGVGMGNGEVVGADERV